MSKAKLLKVFGSALLLSLVVTKLDWRKLGVLIHDGDIMRFSFALALGPAVILLLALRFMMLLRAARLKLPFTDVARITWCGQFFNTCLPGSTGGDIFKIFETCRLFPDMTDEATASVLADRFFALVALVPLAVLAMAMAPLPWSQLATGAVRVPTSIWFIVAAATIGTLLVTVVISFTARARAFLLRILSWLREMLRNVLSLLTDLKLVLLATAAAALVHCTNFFIVYTLSQALGIHISFLQIFALMPVLLVIMLLPVTINGHGLREVVMIGYFSWLGIGDAHLGPRDLAVALSLVFVANDFLTAVPGGVWYMLYRRRARVLATTLPVAPSHE